MIQREVTDNNNTRWTCVQAYSGISNASTEKVNELAKNGSSKVTVVCTPSGGEATTRIEVPENWNDSLSNEQLIDLISKG